MDSQGRFLRQKRWMRGLAAKDMKIDYALDIEVPDENIIDRMSGKMFSCRECGASSTQNIILRNQKKGICDICSGELIPPR